MPSSSYAESTLGVVRSLARRDSKHPEIRLLAQEITHDALPYDQAAEAEALQAFVRDQIRYVRDVYGVETVQSPRLTLRTGSGDCDDKTGLLASLLYAVGFPVRYVLAATNPRQPNSYSHIYPEAALRGRGWCALETIIPGMSAGERVRSFRTHKET